MRKRGYTELDFYRENEYFCKKYQEADFMDSSLIL